MVLPEAHASEGKPISSPGRSRFTDSLAPPRTQQSISLKHRLHSTSKLDLRDHCSDHGSVRPQNPRMLLTKKNPFLFLVTRFFFLETNSRFRWPKAATATSGVHPTVFSLPRWQPGDAPPSTMRRGSFSPPSSLGGVVSNGPATMDPSSPPLTRIVKASEPVNMLTQFGGPKPTLPPLGVLMEKLGIGKYGSSGIWLGAKTCWTCAWDVILSG